MLQDWDIGVGVFPSGKENIVGFAALVFLSLQSINLREAELRQWREQFPLRPSAMIDDFLKLGGRLGVFPCSQTSLPTMIRNRSIWVLRDRGE